MNKLTTLIIACLLSLCVSGFAAETRLAADGRALMPVVISEKASDEVKAHAATLADYLGKISGAKFTVEAGDGTDGIVVGRAEEFPAIATGVKFDPADAMRRE